MVKIYTDGSGSTEGNPIGYSIVVVEDDEIIDQFSWGEIDGTVNIAELKAFIQALKYVEVNKLKSVVVYSDSQYIVKGVTEWMEVWIIKNFQFVKNDDLWRYVNRLINKNKISVKVKWIRGHQKDNRIDGVMYNNIADRLCGLERKKIVEINRQNELRKQFR